MQAEQCEGNRFRKAKLCKNYEGTSPAEGQVSA
jgi:hypothetical protein